MTKLSTLRSLSVLASVVTLAWGRKDVYSAQTCISTISNLVIFTPSTPGYSNASAPFNLRIHTEPSIVVTP